MTRDSEERCFERGMAIVMTASIALWALIFGAIVLPIDAFLMVLAIAGAIVGAIAVGLGLAGGLAWLIDRGQSPQDD